jgi:hypothetical protein
MNQNKPGHLERSLEHFKEVYRNMTSDEIARRTALPFESGSGGDGRFRLRILGDEHTAAFPEFALADPGGKEVRESGKAILFLRYLCGGTYTPPRGRQLSYREIPWGNVYDRSFESRGLLRFAYAFGSNIGGLIRAMETSPALKAERLDKGDAAAHAAYRFEFMTGLFMQVYVWAGDDEFPPSAQMLFDDNFPSAFTAEDIAVIAEVVIDFFKRRAAEGEVSPCGRA